jgi:hypothetical protein
MQHYVTQLLEMLQEAKQNRPSPRYLELPEEMECLRDVIDMEMSLEEEEHTMESIFGIEQIYLPPENRLSDEQICLLIDGITDLWHEFHYYPVFRRGEFTEREQYAKLVNCWKGTYPLVRGESGTWHIEMYDYEQNWDEDELRYLTDEEYRKKHRLPETGEFKFDENDEQPF